MIVAEVIPITSSILTDSLSYFSSEKIKTGTIVTIPLRKKEIKGIVISTSDVKDLKQNLRNQNFKIRNIITVHDETIFSPAYLKTIHQLKSYYVIPAGKMIDITYPKYITKHFDEFCYNTMDQRMPNKRQYSETLLQKKWSDRIDYYTILFSKKKADKESIQIICPTILEAKKITKDILNMFPESTYLLHGKTSSKRLMQTYVDVKKKPCIVISTPQFIDIQALHKSTLVLESNSSSYYYRAVAPHIDYRIFIQNYAQHAKINLIIADSILQPERYTHIGEANGKKQTDMQIFSPNKITLIPLVTKKPSKQTDAERIKNIDKRRAEFSPFSDIFLKHIKKSIKNNEKIFFYTTRKSLAPSIMCRDCGELAMDIESKTPYSLYVKNKELLYINKITGKIIPAFDICQFCGSWRLQTLGIGTESIQKELNKLFPKINTYIIDSTHTKNQTQINKVLKKFNNTKSETKILIGTQKALPYINNIDSSFIVSIDGIFYMQSYINEERALFLIKRIYDNSQQTYIQTRKLSEKNLIQKDKTKEKNQEKDVLQLKFSKKIQSIIKNIQHSSEFGKTMLSQYTESLEIWNIIRSGDYLNFIKNKNESKKQTIIKIIHFAKRSDSIKIYNLYRKRFADYNPHITTRPSYKKDSIDIAIVIHINKQIWNEKYQYQELVKLLPFGERNIHIEINPEIF